MRKPWPREAKGLVRGHVIVDSKARAGTGLCGNSRLKVDCVSDGPGTHWGSRAHGHPSSVKALLSPVPSTASGGPCLACTLWNFIANGPHISLYESQSISFHSPIIFSQSNSILLLSLDFLNQRVSLGNIKISLDLPNGSLWRWTLKIYNLNVSQVLLMHDLVWKTLSCVFPPNELITNFKYFL